MKKTLKGYVAGVLTGALLIGGISYAASTVRIVIDNKEINPVDADGNRADPIIVDGTTYLPVRAVANAFGKAVYWDGPNYTVYLGDMKGTLEYPTIMLTDIDNIGDRFSNVSTNQLIDNYGHSYSEAIYKYGSGTLEALLNMKYSRFRCTLYTPKGDNYDNPTKISIKTDGKTIYTSPDITKTTRPINVDVDVSGCNEFEIEVSGHGDRHGFIADAGFYQ